MKRKWYLMTFIMIAGFIGLLAVSSMIGNTAVTTLGQQWPAFEKAEEFQGTLSDGDRQIPMLLTDAQFRTALLSGQIKESKAPETAPPETLKLHFGAEGREYEVLLGSDGSVCVTEYAGAEQTGKCYRDCTPGLFRALYEEHLLSGGETLEK